jgi:hypothetical protein
MKQKLLTALLIVVLVSSSIGLALAIKVKCPTCTGAGEIECLNCDGTGYIGEAESVECSHCSGTGQVKPNLMLSTMTAGTKASSTDITAVYINREDNEINATITASLDGHSVTSETTVFPPGEDVTIELSIPYNSHYTSTMLLTHIEMSQNADEVSCSYCNGTGTVNEGRVCTKCDAKGKITCTDCGGSGYVTEGAVVNSSKNGSGVDWGLIITIGAVVMVVVLVSVGGFVFIKKRRVSEANLKRLSSREFQQWVLKRLDGKPGTSKDTAMGIDGFSRLNLPISIKQTDAVSMNAIDLFAASLAKNRSTGGLMVSFGFGDDAIRGKVRARTNYRLNIELMTVKELIEGRTSAY